MYKATVNPALVTVTDRKVLVNDASRPWKVIIENRGLVVARYATQAQANRRAKAIRARGYL